MCPVAPKLIWVQSIRSRYHYLIDRPTSSDSEFLGGLEEYDLVLTVILAAAILCQSFVEHLGMEFAERQLGVSLRCHRKCQLMLIIAKETGHSVLGVLIILRQPVPSLF